MPVPSPHQMPSGKVAEALRRDAEFEADPSLGMSLEELDQRIESRRS